MKLSRREFVATAGVFALMAGRVRANAKTEVVVLGAGLSGLSAAYELSKLGFGVTVIEARSRCGGRIYTLREPFSDGLYTETGGELFGDGYTRFIKYADEFNLAYSEMRAEPETGGAVADIQDGIGRNAYLKGKLYERGEKFENHPYGLVGDESRMLPPTLLGKHLREIGNDVRQNKVSLEELDRVSLGSLLKSRGVSKTAIKLIDIAINYNSIHTVSAGAVLNDGFRRREAGTIPLLLEDGNDRLIEALRAAAEQQGVKFHLSTPVVRIEQKGEKAIIHTRGNNGKPGMYSSDKVICTIPFSVLKNIRIDGGISPSKKLAIKNLDYTRITNVFIQAKYAEWDKRALGSSIWTDTPVERIFSTTGRPGDEKSLFNVWTEGTGSRKLEKMSDHRRMQFAVDQFETIAPFMKGSVERTATVSWATDPFSKGAYSHLRIGQMKSLMPHIGKQEGRIHFAGEHTAIDMPGMEGALESAERVVAEISSE